MKDLRDLKDLTIHVVQPIDDEWGRGSQRDLDFELILQGGVPHPGGNPGANIKSIPHPGV